MVIGAAAVSKARAGDYHVAYAINVRGLSESGKYAECVYEKGCLLKFERTPFRIALNVSRGSEGQRYHSILVRIHDSDSAHCCYFADGGDKIWLHAGAMPFHQLAIFEGRKRLGNEYVRNIKIGDIFLAFRDFRSPRK
jgi:hypothetical protein